MRCMQISMPAYPGPASTQAVAHQAFALTSLAGQTAQAAALAPAQQAPLHTTQPLDVVVSTTATAVWQNLTCQQCVCMFEVSSDRMWFKTQVPRKPCMHGRPIDGASMLTAII
jgi:hypothetical protein